MVADREGWGKVQCLPIVEYQLINIGRMIKSTFLAIIFIINLNKKSVDAKTNG